MININRGDEPESLRASRATRLENAVALFNTHGPGSKVLNDYLESGYQVVREDLWHRQHKKCAYCERGTPDTGQPTEHFRPKKGALRNWRERTDKDITRYWWLTWTWENLLFACTSCNSQANKGNLFPLEGSTEPLPAPPQPAVYPLPAQHFELSREQALLLDPTDATFDPLEHLRWKPVDRGLERSMWQWGLHGKSRRGRATAKILDLESWASNVNTTYTDVVWPRFREQIDHKPEHVLRPAWDKLIRDIVQSQLDFTLARWCMLNELRTSTKRLRECELPEPPRCWLSAPA